METISSSQNSPDEPLAQVGIDHNAKPWIILEWLRPEQGVCSSLMGCVTKKFRNSCFVSGRWHCLGISGTISREQRRPQTYLRPQPLLLNISGHQLGMYVHLLQDYLSNTGIQINIRRPKQTKTRCATKKYATSGVGTSKKTRCASVQITARRKQNRAPCCSSL